MIGELAWAVVLSRWSVHLRLQICIISYDKPLSMPWWNHALQGNILDSPRWSQSELGIGRGMKLFLIRHGESAHNVAQLYAGITDSPLTNHGVIQAERLGQYFTASGIRFTQAYASDLQRARKTAEAICDAQQVDTAPSDPPPPRPEIFWELREQDFGPFEGQSFTYKPRDAKPTNDTESESYRGYQNYEGVESRTSMNNRVDSFLDQHLIPRLASEDTRNHTVIAVVAHGIILSVLWRCLLRRVARNQVSVNPDCLPTNRDFVLEHLGSWSNTGYLELDIISSNEALRVLPDPASTTMPDPKAQIELDSQPVTDAEAGSSMDFFSIRQLAVRTINGQSHLKGLKKTRGGVGSLTHDEGQKKIDSFFKKSDG